MATNTAEKDSYHILLVEDNPGDVELTKEIIEESEHEAEVVVVGDGEPAMAYLRQEGEFTHAPRPDLILLDLDLPTKDGIEVLKEMAAREDLSAIPVMILTGTEAEQSILGSYGIPVSQFTRKPIEPRRFDDMIRRLDDPAAHQPIVLPEPPPAAPETKKKRWWPF